MTMTGRDETPPELWRMVVSHLPRDTARQCLFVSKMFHAFAASLLFSTIRLRFGSWQVEYGFNGIPPEEDSGCRSCCIVLRIISDPVFASYVKHLQVIAYPGHDATFEMCCMGKAFGSLHNLRTLEWHSSPPNMMLGGPLLEIIASSCTFLHKIDLPTASFTTPQPLIRLPITSLSVHCTYLHGMQPLEDEYRHIRTPLLSLFHDYRGSLTQLRVFSRALWECPIHILQGLEQLSIYTERDMSNTTLLFHHCARLMSLSIIPCDHDTSAADIIDVLGAYPSALPNLTRFKLHTTEISREQFGHLGRFVGAKKKLRCLDCVTPCHSTEEMVPFLSTLRSLPWLETLGLNLPYMEVNTEYYEDLRRMLPDGLKALRLNFDYDSHTDDVPANYSLWTSLPKLAFAHISDNASAPLVKTRALVVEAKNLQLVGHRTLYRAITRVGNEVELGPHWSDTKLQFPTIDSFENEDWMWLMEEHTLINEFTNDQ